MKKGGFTLIELMVVVAIIAFLATVSVPRYFNYLAKAKQAEVSFMLSSLYAAEQSHWINHGTYSNELSGENGIGWQPEGYNGGGEKANFCYSYGFYFPGAKEGVHYFTGKLGAPKESLSGAKAEKETFTVFAAGEIAKKGKVDIWSMNETKKIEHIQNGIS
jgi:prepilin-type N-terminal cleavage/methylation domain-containing protein